MRRLLFARRIRWRTCALAVLAITLVHPALSQTTNAGSQKEKAAGVRVKKPGRVQPKQDTVTAVRHGANEVAPSYKQPQFHMALRASPPAAQIGDIVRFEVKHSFPVANRALRIALDYADGNRDILLLDAPGANHAFGSAGTFNVTASLVRLSEKDGTTEPMPYSDSVAVRIDSVSLEVIPDVAKVGDGIQFSVPVDSVNPGRMYCFYFGEDDSPTPWSSSHEIRHAYMHPRTYTVFAGIGRLSEGTVVPVTRTRLREVTILAPDVPPPEEVILKAESSHVVIRMPITFTASVVPRSAGVLYRFAFGDGDTTRWQMSRSATHQYRKIGRVNVYVEASHAGRILRSEAFDLAVLPVPPPPDGTGENTWWLWAGAGLVLIASIGLGVRPIREGIFGPRVSIIVRPDTAPPRIRSRKPPGIAVRVILRPRVREGRAGVTHRDNNIIKSIRRKHA
jgi:hypothetical protein